VQCVAAHVVDTVDVDSTAGRGLALIARLQNVTHETVVTDTSRMQVQTFLGRQLTPNTDSIEPSDYII